MKMKIGIIVFMSLCMIGCAGMMQIKPSALNYAIYESALGHYVDGHPDRIEKLGKFFNAADLVLAEYNIKKKSNVVDWITKELVDHGMKPYDMPLVRLVLETYMPDWESNISGFTSDEEDGMLKELVTRGKRVLMMYGGGNVL